MNIEEVKAGLEHCTRPDDGTINKCWRCPYFPQCEEGEYGMLKDDSLKAIEQLEKALEEKKKRIENMEKIIEDQAERIAIMSEGGWHDAEKDQPKKSGKYFVFDENEGILQLEYDECIDDERWGFWEEYFDMETLGSMGSDWKPYPLKVLYWMIMPEPPKAGDQQ